MIKKCLPLLGLLLSPIFLIAQDELVLGFLPNVQVEGRLSGRLDYFLQTGGELALLEKTEGEALYENTKLLNLDLVPGISFDLGTKWNMAAAFVARRRNPFSGAPGTELRPWQQATHILRLGKYRLRNRFRAEQRFTQREKGDDFALTHRLRYRISVDFPLNGDRLDDKELYFNGSAEWLVTLPREQFFFYRNTRGSASIGYQFDNQTRIENGLELRSQNLNGMGDTGNVWFLRTTFIKKF